jgi:hypothetical protein
MDRLTNFLVEFQKLDQTEILKKVLSDKEIKKLILDLNRIDQLFNLGEDSKGKSLGEYAKSTIDGTSKFKGKREKNQPIDRVTLKDTGDFYKSFDIEMFGDDWEITAEDPNDLLGRYGEDVLGLSSDSLAEAVQYVRGNILQTLRKKIAVLLN